MPRVTCRSVLVATFLLAGCATAPVIGNRPAGEVRAELDAAMAANVRAHGLNGDWLVIRGYHATDNLVATITNKPFSHAAVLDLDRDRVIEAEAQGVHESTLADFVGRAHRLVLIRPVWASAASSAAALAKARALVGRPYDFLGLIGLDIPDRFYCSELTLEVYRPFIRPEDVVPRPVEPGQLYYWGRVLYDSGAR